MGFPLEKKNQSLPRKSTVKAKETICIDWQSKEKVTKKKSCDVL